MPSVTRAVALDELETVAGEISSIHLQLAELISAEHIARVESWFRADSQYVTERDRIAEYNTLYLTPDLIKLRGELAAAESRRAFLEFVVHWGNAQ